MPALSYHFSLTPTDIENMPKRQLDRYMEALKQINGGSDGE